MNSTHCLAERDSRHLSASAGKKRFYHRKYVGEKVRTSAHRFTCCGAHGLGCLREEASPSAVPPTSPEGAERIPAVGKHLRGDSRLANGSDQTDQIASAPPFRNAFAVPFRGGEIGIRRDTYRTFLDPSRFRSPLH